METDHQPREIKENRALLRNLVKLSKELHITMSQISDWAVAEQADLTAIAGSLAAIVSGVTILDTLIANFQTRPARSPRPIRLRWTAFREPYEVSSPRPPRSTSRLPSCCFRSCCGRRGPRRSLGPVRSPAA